MEEIPVSLWKHFPIDDLKAESLCSRHLELQRRFDLDLVKFSPSGGYAPMAFGAEIEYYNSIEGAPRVKKYRINTVEDWEELEELDVQEGILGEMLRGVELYAKTTDDSIPFVETVFSPITIAHKLSGKRLLKDLRTEPDALRQALEVISRTMKEFSKSALDMGASGIFFATQLASYDWLSEEEYRAFGFKYDLPILQSIQKRAFFNVLHIHGMNIMFDLLGSNYPVTAVNWHDRRTSPSLKEAFRKFSGVLIGGLNEMETLTVCTPEVVREEVLDAISQTGGRRLILGPGCVIPLNAAIGNLEEVVKTARESVGS